MTGGRASAILRLVSTQPRTRYAKSGDVSIAYRVLGDGPIDLVYVPGFVGHLDIYWEHPLRVHYWNRLAKFSRVIQFDKPGTGLSDRIVGAPSLEERMDDLRAVLDAVGSERAALIGNSEGGSLAILFAATYPERTSALILYGTFARLVRAPDYPHGLDDETFAASVAFVEADWGKGHLISLFSPSVQDDPVERAWWRRLEQNTASPASAVALARLLGEIDVRPVLASIQAPTLVVHSVGDTAVAVDHGRYLAEHISGASYVELPYRDHAVASYEQADRWADEVEQFLTGVRHGPDPDRVLATVLFTDITSSTEHATVIGDRRWRETLDQYDAIVARELGRFRGRQIKTTGDGTLATFDGPARAIRCARAITDAVGGLGFELRSGIHTGEVELRGDDVAGIAVNLGQRVSAIAGSGEVLVSRTVVDLVAGSGILFNDRGEHELKGIPGTWRLFAVKG